MDEIYDVAKMVKPSIYKLRHKVHWKFVVFLSIIGAASRATKTKIIVIKMTLYLITIQWRCRFSFTEYKGARICFDGRSQKRRIE